jgi:hypothetical protein
MKTSILRKPVKGHAAYASILVALFGFFAAFSVSQGTTRASDDEDYYARAACMVIDNYNHMYRPFFGDPDVGITEPEGAYSAGAYTYAKQKISDRFENDYEVQKACQDKGFNFQPLVDKFCNISASKARYYKGTAEYSWDGNFLRLNCNNQTCEEYFCPEKASASSASATYFPVNQVQEIDTSDVQLTNTIELNDDTASSGTSVSGTDEDNYGAPAAGYEEEVKAKSQILLQSAQPEDEVLTDFTMYKSPFSDVSFDNLAGKAAGELYRRTVLGGYADGTFKASKTVNRAEAAKFLLLAKGGEVAEVKNEKQFPDVLDGQWYTKYVVTAANEGIINGYPDGTFRPGNTVNTAEFLKMLANTFGLEENGNYEYDDVKSSDWFAQYAGIAAYFKLFPDRTTQLKPGEPLTRGDVAVAIYQYLAGRNQEQ